MSETTPQPASTSTTSKLMRGAIWIAIGSLIAAAIVCVVWVLIGDQDGIIGRAFLTILLLAAFAGIAIVESNVAARRPEWLVLASMISWIVVLLVGAVKIWLPAEPDYGYGFSSSPAGMRVLQFLVVVGILQLTLLHVRLFLRAAQRYVTLFTRVVVIVTFVMLALLVAMLVFFLTFPDQLHYNDLYWRIVIALAILVAVGTTLIPLLNALFAPRAPRPQAVAPQPQVPQGMPAQPLQAWPTYADGRTPLPVLPDGSPDWNAYYTGYPTYAAPAQSFPVVDAAPQAPYAAPQDADQPASYAPATDAGQSAPYAPVTPDADQPASAAPPAPYVPEPSAPATPPAPPAPDHGVAPQSPPAPPAPPAPPGANGSFPPPPAMPGDAR